MAPNSYRQRLLVAAACGLVAVAAAPARAADTNVANTTAVIGQAAAATAAQTETVIVKQAKRILREKNAPSAVTELGEKQIRAAGISASPGSLLTQAP